MKSIYSIALLLIFGTNAFAQVKFSPEIGVNLNMVNSENSFFSGETTGNSSTLLPGIRAGFMFDFPLRYDWSIQSGFFYYMLNTRTETSYDFTDRGFRKIDGFDAYMLHYLRLPLQVVYKIGALDKPRFYVAAGGYFAYAVGGSSYGRSYSIENVEGVQELVEEKHSFKSMNIGLGVNDQVSPIDYGVQANVGVEFLKGLNLRAEFYYGLNNIVTNYQLEDRKANNWGFNVSIGYWFGDKFGW